MIILLPKPKRAYVSFVVSLSLREGEEKERWRACSIESLERKFHEILEDGQRKGDEKGEEEGERV